MGNARGRSVACAALLLALFAVPSRAADEEAAADEKLLRDAGVGVDVPALLGYFRKRTLSDDDRKQLPAQVRRLGDDDFGERERASKDLTLRGTAALPLLKAALADPDPEIVRRARACIDEIENGPGPNLPMAAARLLARHKPKEAVAVLLAFLPFAEDESVEEETLSALLALTPEGKPDPALEAALRDEQPAKRGAAAFVLGCKGADAQREAARKLLPDKSVAVRFRAAQGLLAARQKDAVPALIALLDDAPPAAAWQIEETLFTLAGEKGPAVGTGSGTAEERRRCREAWAAWWRENGAAADLSLLEKRDRLAGLTLGIEYNTGRVWECGMDGKLRWEIKGLQGPMEAQVLPGGRVLLAESNGNRVSERDFLGNVKWEKKVDGQPTGCQRLPNGNTFVSTHSSVLELNRDGGQVYSFALGVGSNAIRKHRNGNIVFATDGQIKEVTTANKLVRTVPLPKDGMWVGIQDLPGDRFVVANSTAGRVLEVDKDGKILWECKVPGACGVWRLPNGHTLVSTNRLVVELDRSGKKVWETTSEGYVRRVHRR